MRRYERGDTIIEMVMAFAIFAFAAIGTMVVLNKGTSTTQRNLEITLVREQIDTQAEMIRYAHTTRDASWSAMVNAGNLVGTPLSLDRSCTARTGISNGFYLVPNVDLSDPEATTFSRIGLTSLTYVTPETYAKVAYDTVLKQSQGIWVQATRAQQNGAVRAYDFYIHACWDATGLNTPMTLGTIVRIYE